MSVSLDVKLPDAGMKADEALDAISTVWTKLGIAAEAPIVVKQVTRDTGRRENLDPIIVSIADVAEVHCDFHFHQPDPSDYDTGLWVMVSLQVRSVESIALMFGVAVAFAKLAQSPIVDDAHLLGDDRFIELEQIDAMESKLVGLRLEEAGALLAPGAFD